VTGISDATDTVILSGLTQGEEVVTDGTDHLRNGTKVMIPAEMFAKISPEKKKTPHKTVQNNQHRTHHNREQSPNSLPQ
jgi:multidrug efflux system membrane fusion protein